MGNDTGSHTGSDFETIRYEVTDQVATLTLHRPERLNAFTPLMAAEMMLALDLVDGDDNVRALILAGEGRAFCAGADLAGGTDTFNFDVREVPTEDGAPAPSTGEARVRAFYDSIDDMRGDDPDAIRDTGGIVVLRMFRCTKPIIAAIGGDAVGIGVTMCLPADIRLASRTARFGFVFNARGLVPEATSSWFLPRIVGISTALEWCYTAKLISADDALAGGLVRSLHAPHTLLDDARTLAQGFIAGSAPVSAALTRQMMWRGLGAGHPMDAHLVDSRAVVAQGRGSDVAEGIGSFLEKRPPKWTQSVPADLPEWYPWWDEPRFT
ncbi:MAG: crotonase/enoyl-CoA hydratase family protein [Microthrixaceae bacterium]